MGFDKELAQNPNKYAENSSYMKKGKLIHISGYQSFTYNITKQNISLRKGDQRTKIKRKLVENAFIQGSIKGKTVLDLGGNNGLFSLCSLIKGASNAHVVDIDKEAIKNVKKLAKDSKIDNLTGTCSNIKEQTKKKDIVIALALVHWIFDLTTGFGSLTSTINFLRGITKEALIIEWVDPSDPVIINYRHTSTAKNKNEISNYNEEIFIDLLRKNFDNSHYIGSLSNTRKIYIAYDNSFKITKNLEWSNLLYPEKNIISSRALCSNPSGELVYSRVYELKDKFVKQTDLQIGRNERNALNSLDHPSIPKLLFYHEDVDYSVLEIEKVQGQTINQILKSSKKLSDQDLNKLAIQLADSIKYIHSRGIEHRDITPDNLIWCHFTKKLSIIDFGWAQVKNHSQIYTPESLGAINGFYGYVDPKQKKSDYYSAAIILSILTKDKPLDTVDNLISELIIHEINTNKFNLKLFLLSIQNLQKSYSDSLIANENLKQNYFYRLCELISWKINSLFRIFTIKSSKCNNLPMRILKKSLKTIKRFTFI